ncbi:DUF6702 family protein [Lutimonas vermicola]|uniref:DUF6702 family protein n=1 Tax=Lutimonas vermicola TaxID=414288 RepID=A0ABU9KZ42_9FLAO
MRYFHKIIWLLIIPLLAFGMHKNYISLTKVDYIKEQNTVQITMKYFLDDIELALEKIHDQPMELAGKTENKLADKYLEDYIRQKFRIWINEEVYRYTFLGKEYENDQVFFYLELEGIEQINSISVQNSMLFEEFEDQQNYIKLDMDGVQKTFILVRANDREILKL